MNDSSAMFFAGTKEQPYWVPPLTFDAILRQRRLRDAVNDLFGRRIDWRRAKLEDWPAIQLKGDFKEAHSSGLGFVCQLDGKRVFLVPCHSDWGWQALATYDPRDGKWLRLGRFSPDPSGWRFPLPEGLTPLDS